MRLRQQIGLKRLATEASGQEIAEAAIVLPIAFMILLGIFWFGRAYNIYATVTHAAAEGARVAATPTCATCAIGCNWQAGSSLPCNNTVVGSVSAILRASHLDPNQVLPPTTPIPTLCPGFTPPADCTSTGNIRICRGVQLNDPAVSNPPGCGTMVSFQYPYRFFLPFSSLNFQLVKLPAAAESRVED